MVYDLYYRNDPTLYKYQVWAMTYDIMTVITHKWGLYGLVYDCHPCR